MESLTPAQQIIKIVNEELVKIAGRRRRPKLVGRFPAPDRYPDGRPAGQRQNDDRRQARTAPKTPRPNRCWRGGQPPARRHRTACTLGKQLDIPVFSEDPKSPAAAISETRTGIGQKIAATHVIVDTAGRLHIDEE